jgi:predicted nuclease of predicted toxin-antitoxin system
MWLLDANVPIALHEVLASLSIRAETAEFRGWKLLKNGELVEAAYNAGFRCIVTQDDDFKKLSAKYLTRFPDLALVGLRLPQTHWKIYKERFISEWSKNPIQPISGQIIEWP